MAHLQIGEFHLDIERSRLINGNEVISLEPRVLEVLLVLLEKPKGVVSTEEIITQVWGNAVVEPNALHRCIRLLRKAFNDSAQQQSYIETHPKKGYSLVAEITDEVSSKSYTETNRGISAKKLVTYLLPVVAIIVVLITFSVSNHNKHIYQFSNLTPLTATDAVESNSVYSPDGKYIAFLREDETGADHIWWLDVTTRKERRLTLEAAIYRGLAWSPNSENLAFSRIVKNDKSRCLQIEGLYLPQALNSPQTAKVLAKCGEYHYESPQWLDNKRFYALRHTDEQSEVVLVDPDRNTKKVVFTDTKEQIHTIALSQPANKLAITILADQQAPQIFIYNIDDKSLAKLPFEIPAKYSNHYHWHPVWDHLGQGFVFSVGRFLVHMNLAGDFTELHSSDSPDLRLADVNPTGRSLVMTVGKADRDIKVHSISEKDNKPIQTIGRSTVKEFGAKFNPVQEQIAFLSERSGSINVWLEQDGEVRQLSNVAEGVEQFVWSPSGNEIMLFHGGELSLISVSSRDISPRQITASAKITRIFQWLDQSHLLSSIEQMGEHFVAKLNIETGEVQTLHHGYSYWAQQSGESLIILDENRAVLAVKDMAVEPLVLSEQIDPRTPLFVEESSLYFLTKEKLVMLYDLESKQTKLLMKLPTSDAWLTDVDHINKRVLTAEIQARQTELVSFHN